MILAIIQARMSSTRLPGKVMKEILGKPLIGYLLERVAGAKMISRIILATSTDKSNDALAEYVSSLGIEVFRGSENDVLDRYYRAAARYMPQAVVRITGDCPILDPLVIDQVVKFFTDRNFDYVSNIEPPTFPDGMDIEVFSFRLLKAAREKANLPSEREHVTPYMRNRDGIKRGNVTNKEDLSAERWTVDNKEDFSLIKKIIEEIYPRKKIFSMQDVLDYKKKNPRAFKANKKYQRNEGLKRSLKNDRVVKK